MVLSILSVTLWPPKGVFPPAHSPLTAPQPTEMLLPPGLGHHTPSTVTTAKANGPPGAQPSPALASGTTHSSLTLPPRLLLLSLPGYSSLYLLLGCPPFCSLVWTITRCSPPPTPVVLGRRQRRVQTRRLGATWNPPARCLALSPSPAGSSRCPRPLSALTATRLGQGLSTLHSPRGSLVSPFPSSNRTSTRQPELDPQNTVLTLPVPC